jgi:prolyl 4-hydroxylase
MYKNEIGSNQIFTISNFLSQKECEDYITLSENIGYTDAPISTAKGTQIIQEVRNNTRVIVDDRNLAKKLWQRTRDFMPKPIGRWQAVGLNDRFRFYRYEPGQYFAPHEDGSYHSQNGEESALTFLVFLNDGFEGGETSFYLPRNQETRELYLIPIRGMALCFVHSILHEGKAIFSGRKYVLRTDVMYGVREN